MIDKEVVPAYLLTHYLWRVLKLNTNMDESDYGGLVPIVPLAEQPELTQYSGPYIVYGYAESSTGELYVNNRGNIAFAIYSENDRMLNEVCNIIMRTFERGDESARRVNEYTSTIPAFIGIRFQSIEASYGEGGSPESTEGGKQSAVVNIRYECVTDYNIITQVVASTWP